MLTRSLKQLRAVAAVTISCATALVSTAAMAQSPAYMSCGDLWYARNEIYARNGYCFKTQQAIATFGPGCFAPYGRLRGWEQDRVNEIQMWERRKGCG